MEADAVIEDPAQLAGALLDGLLDMAALASPLEELALAFNSMNAALVIGGPQAAGAAMFQVLHADRMLLDSYLPDMPEDPWVATLSRHRGRIVTSGSRLVPQRDYRKTDYYNVFVRPMGHEHIAFAAVSSADVLAGLTLYRPPHRADYGADEFVRLTAMMPALVRFFRLRLAMCTRASDAGRNEVDIDRFGVRRVGACVTDLLDGVGDVAISGDTLRTSGEAGRALRTAIDACLRGQLDGSVVVSLEQATHAVVRPQLEWTTALGRTWTARVEFVRADLQATRLAELAHVSHLTPAERALVAALASGESLRGYACRIERSYHTVRNQLKSVMVKLGVRRQADVVRRMLVKGPAGPP